MRQALFENPVLRNRYAIENNPSDAFITIKFTRRQLSFSECDTKTYHSAAILTLFPTWGKLAPMFDEWKCSRYDLRNPRIFETEPMQAMQRIMLKMM